MNCIQNIYISLKIKYSMSDSSIRHAYQNSSRLSFTMGRQSWLIMNSNKNLSAQCNIT